MIFCTDIPDTLGLVPITPPSVDRHPAAVYLASLQPGSRPGQRSALNKIAELFDTTVEAMNWSALRYPHIQMIRTILGERYAAVTANKMLVALRRVLKEAWLLDYLPEGEYRKLSQIKPIPSKDDDTDADLQGRALIESEIDSLLRVCDEDNSIYGLRDSAIIALGYGLGLRRVEIARAKFSDYRRGEELFVVNGKGNKRRILPIVGGVKARLEKWIAIRGTDAGSMFVAIKKNHTFFSSRTISVRTVHESFQKRVTQSGIASADFHDLRRTFISDLLDKGVDLATASKLAGHDDPTTTVKYDRRKMEIRRRAMAVLSISGG